MADFLSRFTAKEVDFILEEAVRVLVKHKLVRGKTYILDATDLPTTERYPGCGVKKVVKKVWSKEGKEVEVVEYVYGYKLLVLMEARHKLVVAARVVKINEQEKKFTKRLVREAQERTGGAVKVLLVDRGFIDGVLLWWLGKKMEIQFVIPGPQEYGGQSGPSGFSFREGRWAAGLLGGDERGAGFGGAGASLL